MGYFELGGGVLPCCFHLQSSTNISTPPFSRYLYHLGIAPEMEDLHGVAEFTGVLVGQLESFLSLQAACSPPLLTTSPRHSAEEEISAMDSELAKAGVQMPKFGKIGGILAKEVGLRLLSSVAARASRAKLQGMCAQCPLPPSPCRLAPMLQQVSAPFFFCAPWECEEMRGILFACGMQHF